MIKLDELRENPDNPREITEERFQALRKSLREFPQMLRLRPLCVDKDGIVQGGNMRLRALRAEGFTEVPDDWVRKEDDFSAEDWRRFLVVDNEEFGSFDLDKLLKDYSRENLADFGVDVDKLLQDYEPEEGVAGDEGGAGATPELGDLQLDDRMEAAKYVFFAFSGGRDSTRAVYLCAKRFLESGRRCEAVYIGSACEFPDVEQHVRRVCADVGLPLKVLRPDRTFITEYAEKGVCPDPIYMDCVEVLINKPMDAYCKEVCGDEDYILVRGGQPKQKTRRSKTAGQQNPKGKPHLLIYNPLFYATEEQLAAPIPEWRGYAAGFNRTACWCCPFQKAEQYQALKANYPFLYEEMKLVVEKLEFPWHESDLCNQKKFLYWETVEDIPLRKRKF